MKEKLSFRLLLPLCILSLLITSCLTPICNCFPVECNPTRLSGSIIYYESFYYEVQQAGGCTKATIVYKARNQLERFRVVIDISDGEPSIDLVNTFGDYSGTVPWIPQLKSLFVYGDGEFSIDIK